MNNSLAEQIIIDILQERMILSDGQIWVRSQDRKIPSDTKLYVIVGMVSTQVNSAQTYMEERIIETLTKQVEVNRVQTLENIQIDILSRSNDAITRRWEIIAALKSIYAQQKQEANYFKICREPISFLDTSSAEGSSQLNRFTLTIPCFVWYKKETVLNEEYDYYDKFTQRVDDAKTISEDNGLIEFSIGQWEDLLTWIDYEEWFDSGELTT